jgi:phosphatidylinositol alpha-1,6-mannosyltransferase
MAAGVPVIANDDGGTGEQVIDGETGFLVPGLDPDSYAERALCMLGDPALRKLLGENAREHVKQNFSLTAMRERYAGLFRGSQTSMQTYTPKTNVPSAVRSAIAVIH